MSNSIAMTRDQPWVRPSYFKDPRVEQMGKSSNKREQKIGQKLS